MCEPEEQKETPSKKGCKAEPQYKDTDEIEPLR